MIFLNGIEMTFYYKMRKKWFYYQNKIENGNDFNIEIDLKWFFV